MQYRNNKGIELGTTITNRSEFAERSPRVCTPAIAEIKSTHPLNITSIHLSRARTPTNKVVTVSMKATRLNEVFFATIVLGLNGYFIGSANATEGMYVIA